jgi:calcineurin-like phosphoesterase family protein
MPILPMNNQKRSGSRFRTIFVVGMAMLVVASVLFAFTQVSKQSQTQKLVSLNINKGTLNRKPTSIAASESEGAEVGVSFSFTAAGDYGQTSHTDANLNYIAKSGVNFNLAIGDLNYDPTHVTPDAYSAYLKSHLPANFPFEIVAGDHDTDNIDHYAVDLPDHLGHLTGTYAKEYAFDYPAVGPLARFILLSPSNVIPGYLYNKGGSHYNWVAQEIDGARNAHIRWVIVAMHEYCFTIGSLGCPASDLLNLLISKKVDLILQGHKHDYQTSKQLAFNGTTCTALSTTYNSHCVVNATKSLTKGAGSVIVVTGTGGITPMLSIDTADPRMGYFRSWMAANINQTWGVSQFTVTASQLTMKFVGTSGGTFTDNFTIHV